jgi:hypothetical protein
MVQLSMYSITQALQFTKTLVMQLLAELVKGSEKLVKFADLGLLLDLVVQPLLIIP